MIPKPTNARQCVKCITHTVYLLHVSATDVAVFRVVHYKGYIEIFETFLNQLTDTNY
jgi:hypothetical protein